MRNRDPANKKLNAIIPNLVLSRSNYISKIHLSLYCQKLNEAEINEICKCILTEIKLHDRRKNKPEIERH